MYTGAPHWDAPHWDGTAPGQAAPQLSVFRGRWDAEKSSLDDLELDSAPPGAGAVEKKAPFPPGEPSLQFQDGKSMGLSTAQALAD